MLIIMSAAFIDAELQSEFGHLPPSFLPLGNKRLYSRQSQCRKNNEDVVLTLPKSYMVDEQDWVELERLGIKVLKIHDGISLGASLAQALILARPKENESLRILFGDTLISAFSETENSIGIAKIKDDYGWAQIGEFVDTTEPATEDASIQVFSGFFSINDHESLLKSLALANFDFIESLKSYISENDCIFEKNNSWLDFGHVNTYYSSRVKYTTQRAFNDLVITSSQVIKSSSQEFKMRGEANWFQSIPSELKIYTPQFLGEFENNGKRGYHLEYLYNTPLNELFVFSQVSDKTWKSILNSCFDFLFTCSQVARKIETKEYSLSKLLKEKTNLRLQEYLSNNSSSLDKEWFYNGCEGVSIQSILDYIEPFTPDNTPISVMHGDFCFSNIIYDFKTSRIKVIDPRGIDVDKKPTILGSTFYDLAKLSHSLIGMYDRILAGAFELNISGTTIEFKVLSYDDKYELQEWFLVQCESRFGLSKNSCLAMQIHLFLSMLPLHADDPDRQKALFANVFRIFYELRKNS